MIKQLKQLKQLASPTTYAGVGLAGTGLAVNAATSSAANNRLRDLHTKLSAIAEKNKDYEVPDDLYNDLRDRLGLKTPYRKLTQEEAEMFGAVNNAFYLPKASVKQLIDGGYEKLTDDINLKDIQDTGIVMTSPGMHTPDIVSHELGHGHDDSINGLYDRSKTPGAVKLGGLATLLAPLTAIGLRKLGLKHLPTAAITAGTVAVPTGIGLNKHWNEIIADEADANKFAEQALSEVADKYKDQLPPDIMTGGFREARETALDTYRTAKKSYLGNLVGSTLFSIGAGTLGLKHLSKLKV